MNKKLSSFFNKKTSFFGQKNGKIFLLVILFLYLLFGLANSLSSPLEKIPLSEALEKIRAGEAKEIVVIDNRVELKLEDDRYVFTEKEPGASFTEILQNSGIDPATVNLEVDNQNWGKVLVNLVSSLLPLAFTAFLFWYIFKQTSRAQNSIFSFGKSRARLFVKGRQTVTFKDVAGLEEAKEELKEVVDFLKHPEKYRQMGARTPKGVLLVGPSGVGKTLLARATAGEAGVPFFSMAGSEFMEMLVGVGASRVRDLFANAKKAAPAIIFIDEIDAIGRRRGLGVMVSHDEREQTLNQILVEMDGFEPTDRVVVIAATNRGDLLDPALLRPGRFDRRITLTLPDFQERKAILKLHRRGKPFSSRISWEKVARQTVGFSGADLENMLNEAAILAARRRKKTIGWAEIEEAALKTKLGPQKRRLQSEEDKKITAYHEGGHALLSFLLPKMDPVQRVSIVSRGMALGYTLIPPQKERFQETKTYLLSHITTLLGGRAAEEIKFKELTTGAAMDLQQATRIARRMVTDYGMSRLGPVNLGVQIDTEDWTKVYLEPQDISPETRAKVDQEVKRIIDDCYQRAKKLLRENEEILDQLAEKLAKEETLSGEEVKKLLQRGKRKGKIKK
ncbi:ATP-dependent zinc metalloprotease FtsH [bacterium]|nr:ATP-dependent zinc metalloprotease FtsH [bacterium]